MDLGPTELLIILLIIVLLFGVGRISKVARELGEGVRAFREGLKGEDEVDKAAQVSQVSTEQEEKKPPTQ